MAAFIAALDLIAVVAPLNPTIRSARKLCRAYDISPCFNAGPENFHKADIDLKRAANDEDCALAECHWYPGDVDIQIVRPRNMTTNASAMAGLGSDSDFTALTLYTSGTAGRPKAAPLLQSNLQASINSVIESYELRSSGRSILIMSLFHIHGIVAGLPAPLLTGSSVVIPEKGLGPDFWLDFEKHHATWWTATPTHHKVLLSFSMPPKHVQAVGAESLA